MRIPSFTASRLSPLLALLALQFVTGCNVSKDAPPDAAAAEAAPPGETLTQTSESGPVKATVALSPKKPRLGDPLTLTLTVESKAKVTVEMPPFGEALGRFSIVNFTPRTETAADGSVKNIQRYVLDAPMSGRQRIPSLRIEFTDARPGAAPGPLGDGGADPSAPHELLTDEIAIDIASVLPEGQVQNELKGLRGPLESSVARGGFAPLLKRLGVQGVRKVVFLVVSAEVVPELGIDQSSEPPSIRQMASRVVDTLMANISFETQTWLRSSFSFWRQEARELANSPDSPYDGQPDFYLIETSLRDIADPAERKAMMAIPTTFKLAPEQVQSLQQAGRTLLDNAPEFKRLVQDLQ